MRGMRMFMRPAGTRSPLALNPAINRRATFKGPYRDPEREVKLRSCGRQEQGAFPNGVWERENSC